MRFDKEVFKVAIMVGAFMLAILILFILPMCINTPSPGKPNVTYGVIGIGVLFILFAIALDRL